MSVEPERGRPTMKYRIAGLTTPVLPRRKEVGRESRDHPVDARIRLARVIANLRAPMGIGLRIIAKGTRGLASVLQCLAEREFEMEACLAPGRHAGQRRFHGGDVALVQRHCLEVRERPPGLAQRRIERDGTAIGRNAPRQGGRQS